MEVPLEHINHDTFTAEKYVRWPGATSPSVLGLSQILRFSLRVPTSPGSQQKTPWSEPMPAPGRNGASNGDLLPGQMLGQRCVPVN